MAKQPEERPVWVRSETEPTGQVFAVQLEGHPKGDERLPEKVASSSFA